MAGILNPHIPALKWAGAGLITLSLLAFFTWQRLEIQRLESVLATTLREKQQAEVTLGVQSLQIQTWKKAADDRAQQAEQALAEARKSRDDADKRARALYTLNLPKEECDALIALVDAARGADPADSLR